MSTGPARAQAEAAPHRRSFDTETLVRRRRLRLRMHLMVSTCYVMDTALLFLFALAGTIPLWVAGTFAGLVGVMGLSLYLLLASPLPDRTRDQNLTTWHVAAASAIQILLLALAPQLAFLFFLILFNIFAFGAFRMSVRAAMIAWLAIAAAAAIITLQHGAAIGLPNSTAFEQALVWLSFVLVLGRCIFLGLYGTAIRNELRRRHDALAASMRQVEELASRDELTGVLNRRSLLAAIDNQIAEATRDGTPFSIALFDLDHFKEVNDRLGHCVGDEVLVTFARAAAGSLRTSDRLGRYGGDEFMLVMPATVADAAAAVVARLRATFDAVDWQALTPGMSLAASAGVAQYQAGDDAGLLVRRADTALYEAKRARIAAAPLRRVIVGDGGKRAGVA